MKQSSRWRRGNHTRLRFQLSLSPRDDDSAIEGISPLRRYSHEDYCIDVLGEPTMHDEEKTVSSQKVQGQTTMPRGRHSRMFLAGIQTGATTGFPPEARGNDSMERV
jgi:hypothetical protein